MDKLTVFNIVLSLGILVVVIMLIIKLKQKQDQKPTLPNVVVKPVFHHMKPRIGGCAGTRFGCCPNGRTPRANPWGSNC